MVLIEVRLMTENKCWEVGRFRSNFQERNFDVDIKKASRPFDF
jgi:hypothetical protein